MKTATYKSFYSLYLLLFLVFGCHAQQPATSLDYNAYLALSDKDNLYPTPSQLELLASVVPEKKFQSAPPIEDRKYWNKIAKSESGKEYLAETLKELHKAPEVPISDEIYRRANLEGNRGIYKPRYYRTMGRLEHFVLSECMENKGQFLPQINTYIKAIMEMKSWIHPNHDDSKNGVLEGRRMTIDLGSRRFGSDLALAVSLLGNKLSNDLKESISANLQKRIIDSYLTSCGEWDGNNKWIKSTSNWNSVCTSGSVFTTIASSNDHEQRMAGIGSGLNSMAYYLSGFGEDGYCSEGAGYWNYGFGHYLYLAQILYDYTDGKIDLFNAGNPKKLKNVGNFPQTYQIHPGICAPFSDGVSKVSNDRGFAYTMSAKYYDASMPKGSKKKKSHDSYSAVYQLIKWNQEESVVSDQKKTTLNLPGHTYFYDFGMVISRGNQKTPLSIAMKAGHNAENHNHSDVGTYTLVMDKDIVTGDIGAPSYRAGAFSPDNPARSSWGHPVPRVDGSLQSNGKEFAGKIIETKFSENQDKIVMDIKPAYEVPSLESLVRTMTNDKTEEGSIVITDVFSASEPIPFGTAIMTLSDYEILDNNTIVLSSKNQKIKAEVTSDSGKLIILDELVPVEHLREKGPAYRIGIDFKEPMQEGTINITFTPLP